LPHNELNTITTSVLADDEIPIRVSTNHKLNVRVVYVGSVVTLLSLLARAWGVTRVGLTHYDEGVYLLSSFWSLHHGPDLALFPWQKLFSPPGYFGLIGVVNWLFGNASDLHAIAINVAFGWLTVLAAYWAGRRWFGTGAGIASAVLIGFSQFQIAFSRSALTDTGFTFFFLISLALIAVSLERNAPIWGVAAGLAIGATWNMKYHGWILLALAFVGMAIKGIAARTEPEKIKKLALSWLVMTAVAVAAFLPWLLYTQLRLGGYAEVVHFHNRFMNLRWAHNFQLQAEMQVYFDGWLSRVSPALALLSAAICSPACGMNIMSLSVAALLLLLASTILGGTVTCLVLAFVAVPKVWRSGSEFGRLLVITFGAFFLLLPCYQAFARLLLPFSVVTLLLAGYALKFFLESARVREVSHRLLGGGKWRRAAAVAAPAVLSVLAIVVVKHPEPHTWAAETGYRDAAKQLASAIPTNGVVFVLAEPEVAFYFQSEGRQTFCICIDPQTYQRYQATHPFRSDSNVPQYVVAGFYAKAWWNWNPAAGGNGSGRYRMLARVPAAPGDIRLLDDFPTKESRRTPGAVEPMYDLYLYEHLTAGVASSSKIVR
jgi:4-amino-4-deoxy-L-arabinose transferase-like glycosyltransferase